MMLGLYRCITTTRLISRVNCTPLRYIHSMRIHIAPLQTNPILISSTPTTIQRCGVTPLTAPYNATQIRLKSKKAKEAKKKKGSSKTTTVSDEDMEKVVDYPAMIMQMEALVEKQKKDFVHNLSVRTNVGVFDQLEVKTSDGTFPLIQLGQIVQKNPQLVVINLSASPQFIPDVKKAFEDSGMNVSPQQDGTTLFVPIPKLTVEYREGLSKNAKSLFNKTKDDLRKVQNKFLKIVNSADGQSKDVIRDVTKKIHETELEFVNQAEQMMKDKQKELLGK